jgi:uroporphyrin-III C-methyltransferase
MSTGRVYIVGAGPGDPSLLTEKAKNILADADVVVYDRLVSNEILQRIPKHVEKIFVGKSTGSHPISQHKIHSILVSKAKQGNHVVRLKGGDPFLFGRGGEEAQELRKAKVSYEIVPGITSALAVPAYAGIPITHRNYASSIAIVTGHEYPNKREKQVNWKKLATSVDTIIILMGVGRLQSILNSLIEGGRDKKTPVAVIERGTTKHQRITVGRIGRMAKQAAKRKVKPPAVVVIGDVVKLQKELSWFKR